MVNDYRKYKNRMYNKSNKKLIMEIRANSKIIKEEEKKPRNRIDYERKNLAEAKVEDMKTELARRKNKDYLKKVEEEEKQKEDKKLRSKLK